MITISEVIEMSGLSVEEVDAIAEHEHLPEAAAVALAAYLLEAGPDGHRRIVAMIRDDIRLAVSRGDQGHAAELLSALRHFLHDHPTRQPA
ncbi:MAG: hypothetical protein AAFT19_08290 [Pseudomonadota bacterium]